MSPEARRLDCTKCCWNAYRHGSHLARAEAVAADIGDAASLAHATKVRRSAIRQARADHGGATRRWA